MAHLLVMHRPRLRCAQMTVSVCNKIMATMLVWVRIGIVAMSLCFWGKRRLTLLQRGLHSSRKLNCCRPNEFRRPTLRRLGRRNRLQSCWGHANSGLRNVG